MTKKILIGKINSIFGIKGEVKIVSYASDPLKMEKYQLFDEAGNPIKLKISNKNKAIVGTSNGDPILIVKIDGIDNRNAAELLRGKEIFANRSDFDNTAKNEFYYVDLIGLDVIDHNSKKIGKVINVFNHGAGGVIEIEFNSENLPQNYEKIENFPFKNEIFPSVDLENNFIQIHLPEPLLAEAEEELT
jgi:16S rRNA processing protein RimM